MTSSDEKTSKGRIGEVKRGCGGIVSANMTDLPEYGLTVSRYPRLDGIDIGQIAVTGQGATVKLLAF